MRETCRMGRVSFDGRDTQRMQKGSSMRCARDTGQGLLVSWFSSMLCAAVVTFSEAVCRCTTSQCVLPVINLAPLDNDW